MVNMFELCEEAVLGQVCWVSAALKKSTSALEAAGAVACSLLLKALRFDSTTSLIII